MLATAPRQRTERILGWDFLRGLCAVAVCGYHLLSWLNIATLHTFGHYGVYLFFVLSGASLAYTYGGKFSRSAFSFKDFLLTRYFRLAPLYAGLLLVVVPWKLSHEPLSLAFLAKLGANVFFLFGWFYPATQSMLVGGWSLGIEAVFYTLFPVMMWTLSSRYLGWLFWLVLLVVQVAWIHGTIGADSGYLANTFIYHHAPAFAAYFMGGCLIGHYRLTRELRGGLGFPLGVALTLGGFVVMALLDTPDPAGVLTGWRGVCLATLCFALVTHAGYLRHGGAHFSAVAQRLGDATYGLYLIHPVLFFGLSFVFFPKLGINQPPDQWPMGWRLALALAVMGSSFFFALASEQYFEHPIRQRVRRYLDRRAVDRAS